MKPIFAAPAPSSRVSTVTTRPYGTARSALISTGVFGSRSRMIRTRRSSSAGSIAAFGLPPALAYSSPARSTLTMNGSRDWSSSGLAAAFGSSTLTPWVRSGAVTMKMMSSTSITSM